MPTTTGMKAGGFYDEHSSTQRAALEAFLPWLEEVISGNLLPLEGRPICVLDLGSSEGANAIHAMGRLIDALRRKTSEPVWVFFDDLPTNDFNRLFANLYPNDAPALPGADVYAAAVGGSAGNPTQISDALYRRVAERLRAPSRPATSSVMSFLVCY